MPRPVVLLAVPMAEERRRIAQEKLGSPAEVLVRSDLDDAALARRAPEIDVLVTGGFPRDIPADVWPRMARLRLLQTVAAGVDHLPYDVIPPRVTVCSNAGAHRIAIRGHSMALLPPPAPPPRDHRRAGTRAHEAGRGAGQHRPREADPRAGSVRAPEGEPGVRRGPRRMVGVPEGGGSSVHGAVPRAPERRDDPARRVGDPRAVRPVPRGGPGERRPVPPRGAAAERRGPGGVRVRGRVTWRASPWRARRPRST